LQSTHSRYSRAFEQFAATKRMLVTKGTRHLKTILIIDDEPVVLRVAATALSRQGYGILSAANQAEGLRLCDDQKRAGLLIDLAIVDVVMPGMSGPELIECLRYYGIVPDGILYMSGYPREFAIERRGLDPNGRFLQKPFTVDKLLSVVQELLGDPGT
jgi:two-component system, cell cycle sensor histidine kinase and response regulator CckA